MAGSGIEARRQAALEVGSAGYLARRQELIRAAANVFRERGHETTLRDVADAIGTERASIYYYIGSKDELRQAIVSEALERDLAAAQAIKRSRKSTPEKIRALIESMVLGYAEYYPHINVYVEQLGRIAHEESKWATEVIEDTKRYEALVLGILRKGQEDGSLRADLPVEVASMGLFGMINWMYRWYRPTFGEPPQEIARSMAEIFLGGFAVGD
ncbi:MAG TPA: TetR/AcrR family transcriptional regulator [Sporichthyaceae bacterium]|jgi:AcrR family transcriptional regulator|nr:TetR/AcrR family transcriptional regulator [Sporichthyaceae bacterium]